MKVQIEEISKDKLPKELRDLPDLVASHLYCYRALSRGVARRIHAEYEESLSQGAYSFSLLPATLFILKAAAEGVIGNVAYAAIVKAVSRIRKPKMEFIPGKLSFEQVVSRRTYSRYRREAHPEGSPSRIVSIELERKIEEEYWLMVPRKKKTKTSKATRRRKRHA